MMDERGGAVMLLLSALACGRPPGADSGGGTGSAGTSGGPDGCDLRAHGAGCFGDEVPSELPPEVGLPVLAADLDGDGLAELVTSSGWVGRRDAPGRYGFIQAFDALSSPLSGPQGAVDLDGDGALDLVGLELTPQDEASLWVAWGDGDGALELQLLPLTPLLDGRPCGSVTGTADLNEDGATEVLVVDPPGLEVVILAVDRQGAREVGRVDLSLAPQWQPVACDEGVFVRAGDLDGDGHDDLAVIPGDPVGLAVAAFGDGSGALSPPVVWDGPNRLSTDLWPFPPRALRQEGLPGVVWATDAPTSGGPSNLVLRGRIDRSGVGTTDGLERAFAAHSMPQLGRLAGEVALVAADLNPPGEAGGEILVGCVGPEQVEPCGRIPIARWDAPLASFAATASVLVISDADAPGLLLPRGDPLRLGWIPLRDDPRP